MAREDDDEIPALDMPGMPRKVPLRKVVNNIESQLKNTMPLTAREVDNRGFFKKIVDFTNRNAPGGGGFATPIPNELGVIKDFFNRNAGGVTERQKAKRAVVDEPTFADPLSKGANAGSATTIPTQEFKSAIPLPAEDIAPKPQRAFPDTANVGTYKTKDEFNLVNNPPEITATTQSRSVIPPPEDTVFYEDLTPAQRSGMFQGGMNFRTIGMPKRDFNPDELIPSSRNKPNYLGEDLPPNYAGRRSDYENPKDIMIHRANLSGRGPTWNTTVARPDEQGRYIEGPVGASEFAKRNYAIASDPSRSAIERARAAAEYLSTGPDQSGADILKQNQNNMAAYERQRAKDQAAKAEQQASIEAAQKIAEEESLRLRHAELNRLENENGDDLTSFSEFKKQEKESKTPEKREPVEITPEVKSSVRKKLKPLYRAGKIEYDPDELDDDDIRYLIQNNPKLVD